MRMIYPRDSKYTLDDRRCTLGGAMNGISTAIDQTIGGTPLVRLNRLAAGLPGTVAIKLESRNPGGSVKDRIGLAMIDDAEDRGEIERGRSVIIEPTSGNTGIALALVGARARLPRHPDDAGVDVDRATQAARGRTEPNSCSHPRRTAWPARSTRRSALRRGRARVASPAVRQPFEPECPLPDHRP